MAIVQTLTFSAFCDSFKTMGRAGQFSRPGLRVLFDFLEDYSEQSGEHFELDVISLCCDYVEMTHDEIRESYSEAATIEDDDELMEWLVNNTLVCGECSEGIVFAQF